MGFHTGPVDEIDCRVRKLMAQNLLVTRTLVEETWPQFDHARLTLKPRDSTPQTRIHDKLNIQGLTRHAPRPCQLHDKAMR